MLPVAGPSLLRGAGRRRLETARDEGETVGEEERRAACRRQLAGATFASDKRGCELEIEMARDAPPGDGEFPIVVGAEA